MATDIVAAARGWIGTPYQHQASLKGVGCDCLGLLRGVWRECLGAEPEVMPPYARDGSPGGTESLRDGLARHLASAPLAALSPGDVMLFRLAARGPARHCAIAAAKGGAPTLIHARQNARVREEAFTPYWQARLAHVFRAPAH